MGLANSCPGSLTKAVVETSTGSDQVAGIVVTPELVTVGPHKSSCRVPVEITNNTDHTKATLASLKIAKDVITPTATENTGTTDCNDDFSNLFDLEATNLNAEHREQMSRVYLVKQDKHRLTLLIVVYFIVNPNIRIKNAYLFIKIIEYKTKI